MRDFESLLVLFVRCLPIEYSNIRLIDYECESFEIDIIEKIFETKTIYKIKASEDNMRNFLEKVSRLVSIVA
ncbi:MAG: hypothetical protein QM497_01830 [Sulfurimonas sp.]